MAGLHIRFTILSYFLYSGNPKPLLNYSLFIHSFSVVSFPPLVPSSTSQGRKTSQRRKITTPHSTLAYQEISIRAGRKILSPTTILFIFKNTTDNWGNLVVLAFEIHLNYCTLITSEYLKREIWRRLFEL